MSVSDIARRIKESADSAGGGSYLNPGKGEVLITEAKLFTAKNSGTVFAANFVVDKCTGFEVKDANQVAKPCGNPIGSVAGIAAKLEEGDKFKKEYAFRDMTGFLCAALNETKEDIAGNLANVLALDDSGLTAANAKPMRGIRVGYVTREIMTNPKTPGVPKKALTKVDFFHIPQTKEDIASACAKLDGK